MAKNRKFGEGRRPTVAVPVGTVSGDLVVVGAIAGIALFDRDSDGESVLDTEGVYEMSVKGVNDAGDSAVAVGDEIFYNAADDPVLSKKASGRLIGIALGIVALGATTAIKVKLLGRAVNPVPFISAEATGTGAEQEIAHTLGVVPSAVLVVPTDLNVAVIGAFTVAEGVHTATKIKVTVTLDKKFKVYAQV